MSDTTNMTEALEWLRISQDRDCDDVQSAVATAQVYATLALVDATERQTDEMVNYEGFRKLATEADSRVRVAIDLVGKHLKHIDDLKLMLNDEAI